VWDVRRNANASVCLPDHRLGWYLVRDIMGIPHYIGFGAEESVITRLSIRAPGPAMVREEASEATAAPIEELSIDNGITSVIGITTTPPALG
jgi:hypothetical protein